MVANVTRCVSINIKPVSYQREVTMKLKVMGMSYVDVAVDE